MCAVLSAAIEVFIARGYRRTQMADVAKAAGVGKGTLYGYVSSKEALFDAAMRFADAHTAPPEVGELPLPTPAPGATVAYLKKRLHEELRSLSLLEVQAATEPGTRAELDRVLRDLYRRLSGNRVAIKLIDRCANDQPELATAWFTEGRWAQMHLLDAYLRRGIEEGWVLPLPDTAIAARFALETIALWAMHRHWDPAPQALDEESIEDAIIELLLQSLTLP